MVVQLVLLIVLVLLLIDMGVFPWHIDVAGKHSLKEAAGVQMGAFRTAFDMFKEDNGFYPTGTNGLNDLVVQPAGVTNWHQYLEKISLDPWGHPYLYEFPGKHWTNLYDLSSAGPDGKAGTEDDIVNWK
jgi:general secretion pathway protein G